MNVQMVPYLIYNRLTFSDVLIPSILGVVTVHGILVFCGSDY